MIEAQDDHGHLLRFAATISPPLVIFESRFSCVRMTPFGSPVEPEVYMIVARSWACTDSRILKRSAGVRPFPGFNQVFETKSTGKVARFSSMMKTCESDGSWTCILSKRPTPVEFCTNAARQARMTENLEQHAVRERRRDDHIRESAGQSGEIGAQPFEAILADNRHRLSDM